MPPQPLSTFWERRAASRKAKYGPSQGAQVRAGRFEAKPSRSERKAAAAAASSPSPSSSSSNSGWQSSSGNRQTAYTPPKPPTSRPSSYPSSNQSGQNTVGNGASTTLASDTTSETQEAPASQPKTFSPSDLPFADPIPGKEGYVTLPKGNPYRGEIDVRGMSSGTPVEIPDPNKPGETVQFRVP